MVGLPKATHPEPFGPQSFLMLRQRCATHKTPEISSSILAHWDGLLAAQITLLPERCRRPHRSSVSRRNTLTAVSVHQEPRHRRHEWGYGGNPSPVRRTAGDRCRPKGLTAYLPYKVWRGLADTNPGRVHGLDFAPSCRWWLPETSSGAIKENRCRLCD